MAAYILPTIGTVGTYTLSSPFNSLVDPNVNYSCEAIRTLNEMVSDNLDPYDLIYKTVGLTQADYTTDLNSDMQIVKLVSGAGQIVYVPAKYIAQYPTITGVQYHSLALTTTLPAMQVNKDLSSFINDLQQFFLSKLGVYATVNEVELSEVYTVTEQDAQNIENARQAQISENGTYYTLYKKATNSNQLLLTQLNALEGYVLNYNARISSLKEYANSTNNAALIQYMNTLGL